MVYSDNLDEDSAKKDDRGLVDNLAPNQLRAPAEIELFQRNGETRLFISTGAFPNTKSDYLVNFVPYKGLDALIRADHQNALEKSSTPLLAILDRFQPEQRFKKKIT
ncbi:hypothetical protein ILUMI_18426, partial [Ignelater luminosus]